MAGSLRNHGHIQLSGLWFAEYYVVGKNVTDRNEILGDRDFWTSLEYASSRQLATASNGRFWIDGFVPEMGTNTKRGLSVEGTVWVGEGGRVQHQYHFVASIPQKLLHRNNQNFEIESLSLQEVDQTLELVVAHRKQIASAGG